MTVKLLSGNSLANGRVVWWTGSGWSQSFRDAAPVDKEQGLAIAAEEEQALRIVSPELVDAVETPDGYRLVTMRDRVRALGPSTDPAFVWPAEQEAVAARRTEKRRLAR